MVKTKQSIVIEIQKRAIRDQLEWWTRFKKLTLEGMMVECDRREAMLVNLPTTKILKDH